MPVILLRLFLLAAHIQLISRKEKIDPFKNFYQKISIIYHVGIVIEKQELCILALLLSLLVLTNAKLDLFLKITWKDILKSGPTGKWGEKFPFLPPHDNEFLHSLNLAGKNEEILISSLHFCNLCRVYENI